MAGRLHGKVALITGCGSVGPGWGNGKAMAVLFAREGAQVFVLDINAEAAAETSAIIAGEGGTVRTRVADVGCAEDVAAAVGACLDAFGRIDILVNNVGIARVGGPVELDEAVWDEVMRVNLKSVYLTCRAVLPLMQQQRGGAIVNNASIAAHGWCGVNYGLYGASKGAMISLTRSLAVQYAPDGVRANCVCPGLMNTPLVHKALTHVYGAEGDIATLIATRDRQCPMGHMGDGWDTAYAALFLASDEARYITGVALDIDGGFSLRFA